MALAKRGRPWISNQKKKKKNAVAKNKPPPGLPKYRRESTPETSPSQLKIKNLQQEADHLRAENMTLLRQTAAKLDEQDRKEEKLESTLRCQIALLQKEESHSQSLKTEIKRLRAVEVDAHLSPWRMSGSVSRFESVNGELEGKLEEIRGSFERCEEEKKKLLGEVRKLKWESRVNKTALGVVFKILPTLKERVDSRELLEKVKEDVRLELTKQDEPDVDGDVNMCSHHVGNEIDLGLGLGIDPAEFEVTRPTTPDNVKNAGVGLANSICATPCRAGEARDPLTPPSTVGKTQSRFSKPGAW